VDVLRGVEGLGFVYFGEQDVVRHPLVQRIVRAYERYGDMNGPGRQMALALEKPVEGPSTGGPAELPETQPASNLAVD
jgi:phosphate starvation-inducible PhoH-like protein